MNLLYLTEDYLHSKVHNNLLVRMLEQNESMKIYVFVPIRLRTGKDLSSGFEHNERLIEVTVPIDIPINIYKIDFWAKIRCKVRLIERNIPIKEIDVIHAATLFTEGSTARALQRKYGIPFFVSARGTDCSFYAAKMIHLWPMSCDVIRHANVLAYVTPTIKKKLMACCQYRMLRGKLDTGKVINNGIDLIWLENLCLSPRTVSQPVRVLYIGRFDTNKNVLALIEAIKKVNETIPIRLTLVGGDGDQQRQVEQHVADNPDLMEYLGKVYDKNQLLRIVRQCDIFAMVSHAETFGLVYAECLTQGLPLLYTLNTGFDEMYSQGTVGYGVDSHSVDSVADGLRKIIVRYDTLRNNISRIDLNCYSWHSIALMYMSIYANIKDQKRQKNWLRKSAKDLFYFFKMVIRRPSDRFNHNAIHSTTRIASGSSLKFCTVGRYNYISSRNSLYNVEIGNYCSFGPDIHIGGMQHSYWWYSMSPWLSDQCKSPDRTIIGNDVWIGAQAIIKQGITIGNGAVIGANSFVNKDVPPYAIVVGSPAKVLKYRFDNDRIAKIEQTQYWNYSPNVSKAILNGLDIDNNGNSKNE